MSRPVPEPDLEALRAARERARALGQPHLLRAYAALAAGHLVGGQLDEAESAARVAVQQARTWAEPADLGRALVLLARILARGQRTDRALLHYTEGLAWLERAGTPAARAEADAARPEVSALSDVPPDAR